MKHQILSNLEIVRILLDESRVGITYLAEDDPEIETQRALLEATLLELTWFIMNRPDSNY